MANRQIDPDKLRAAVRRLGDDYVFYMLNEAIDLLPQAKLLKLVKGDPVDVCQAFEIIFGLLDHIDECLDDVSFFADEARSWQVGVDWNKVLPSWF